MSRSIICPYNIGQKCCKEEKPISVDKDNYYKCKNGHCAFIGQINILKSMYRDMETVINRIEDVEDSLGVKEGETTISGGLAKISSKLAAIKNGSHQSDSSEVVSQLENIASLLGEINSNTWR